MEVSNIRPAVELPTQTGGFAASSEELGRTQFLELMIAQLSNQDPLNPAQNEDFIAQLAQFSSLEGIQNLNQSMEQMANSIRSGLTLESASLVGRSVLVPTNQVLSGGNGFSGSIELSESSGGVSVEIMTAAGELVRRVDLGARAAGEIRFRWDGTNQSGDALPEGIYRVRATSESGGAVTEHTVNLPELVVSVSVEQEQVTVNLAGGTSVPVVEIREIQ